jgi:4-amino-4-deoxy-L-arabinose transferase-like glycosyltransferase
MKQFAYWLRSNPLPLTLLGLLLLISFTVNLVTIATFPSWDDEAYMANISFNLAQGHGRVFDMLPWEDIAEVNRYGPLYFHLQATIIRLFGLHDWLFRLPNLISSYLGILLIALTLRNAKIPGNWTTIYVVLAVLDISVNRNMVGGRMDMLATFFVCLSLFLIHARGFTARVEWSRWLLVGVSSAMAFLTTPRALFLLPIIACTGLARIWSDRGQGQRSVPIGQTLLALGSFVLPVALWIGSLGGLAPYLAIQNSSVVRDHIAPSFFRSVYDNIGISAMLVLALMGARQIIRSALLTGLILTYFTFSLFVREIGPYAGMIMPFVLAAVAALLSQITMHRAFKTLLVAMILLPSLTLLSLRAADLPLNADCRQAKPLTRLKEQLATEDRQGLKVVADYKYFFQLEGAQARLLALEGTPVQRQQYLRDADLVLDQPSAEPPAPGLKIAGSLSCRPRRLPILPASFYERSIYNETMYIRPRQR